MALTESERVDASGRLAPATLLAKAWAFVSERSEHSRVRRLAGAAFLVRIASAVLAFASQVLLARWMGPFEFGIYVYAWTWVLLIGGICDLGLATSAQRFIPEYTERKQDALLRGFLSGSRWLAVGTAGAIAVVAAVAVMLATPRLDQFTVLPLYLACIALPIYGLSQIQAGIARSFNWVNLALLPAFVIRQVLIIALMAAIFFAALPTSAVAAMLVTVVAALTVVGGQFFVLNRKLAGTMPPGPKLYRAREWYGTSLPIFLVEGFYLLLTYADIIVLQQFRSPEEVAVYYAAVKTLAPVAFVYFAVAQTTAHKFTQLHVAGDRRALAGFLARTIRLTFWPTLALAGAVLLLGKPLLGLFGVGFSDGYHLMFIVVLGLLARAAVGPVERLLNMLGEQRLCATVYAGAFGLNLVLCIVLIPRLGGAGAAIATATALVVESILLFAVTKRRLGFHGLIFGPRGSS